MPGPGVGAHVLVHLANLLRRTSVTIPDSGLVGVVRLRRQFGKAEGRVHGNDLVVLEALHDLVERFCNEPAPGAWKRRFPQYEPASFRADNGCYSAHVLTSLGVPSCNQLTNTRRHMIVRFPQGCGFRGQPISASLA